MRVVVVPSSLEERTFDELLREIGEMAAEADGSPVLFDARRVRWVDPYGMLVLLAAGTALRAGGERAVRIQLPEDAEVRSYLARMRFLEHAGEVFGLDAAPSRRAAGTSEVLLEVTPIASHGDVHGVVDRVQDRAGTILSSALGYPSSAVVQFSVLLSEVCQNVVEHAEAPGWVAAQSYHWARRLGRTVLVLAVADLGIGFRGSLAEEHAGRFGERWSDATALEAAFIHGLTRFPDSGRGQGIQQIRKQVRRWGGRIAIRSGTARIADVPDWDDTPPLEDGLPRFPGAQIGIVLPAADGRGGGGGR